MKQKVMEYWTKTKTSDYQSPLLQNINVNWLAIIFCYDFSSTVDQFYNNFHIDFSNFVEQIATIYR